MASAPARRVQTRMNVDVLNESGADVDVVGLTRLCRFTMRRMRLHPATELTVRLVDPETIATLNEQWMGKKGPTSVPLGLTTALAVAAHEIPQEVGDVAILLRAGYSRWRAFTLNVLSGLGGILGAAAMVVASRGVPSALPYVLAFAAGNFLYVAMADLIPGLHRDPRATDGVQQLLLIGAGIGTIALL